MNATKISANQVEKLQGQTAGDQDFGYVHGDVAETKLVNVDALIARIGTDDPHVILALLEIDLHGVRSTEHTHAATREWHEPTENRWWSLWGRQLSLSPLYAVRWTVSDEAGVADVEIVERLADADSDGENLIKWMEGLCKDLGDGKVRDAE